MICTCDRRTFKCFVCVYVDSLRGQPHLLDEVIAEGTAFTITKAGKKAAVVLPASDFEAMKKALMTTGNRG